MFAIFLHIVCYDLWFYITHVILHHPSFYYIHKIHHSTPYETLIFLDTNVGDVIENTIQPLGIFIPCLGNNWYVSELVFAFIIVGIRAMMRHDHRCTWLIGNHHLLHHKHPKYNFGEYWIDYYCGTVYPDDDEYIYGILYT